MQPTEQEKLPARTMEVCFTHDSARAGNAIMAQLYTEGWETLHPLQYAECGHYWTILYLPQNAVVTHAETGSRTYGESRPR